MSQEIYPGRVECPICGHYMNFVLSKEATLQSLEDMNWKDKVRKAIDKVANMGCGNHAFDDGFQFAIRELKKELNLK